MTVHVRYIDGTLFFFSRSESAEETFIVTPKTIFHRCFH